MMRRTLAVAGLVVVLLAAAFFLRDSVPHAGSVHAAGGARAAAADPAAGSGGAADPDAPVESAAAAPAHRTPALPVGGVVAERGPFVLTVRATGRAEARRRAELSLPVSERVTAVHVTEGDRVAAGAELVTLEPRPFEITRREAEARLATAESDFRILLLSEGEVSDERRTLAENRSGVTEARENVKRAEMDVEGTRLRAPFAGSIAAVSAEIGERAVANEPLVTLVDLGRIRIRAEVLESDFGRLRAGAAARVRFAAFPGETFTGEVEALGPEVDAARGTGAAYVRVDNPNGRIKPGMYAELEIAGTVYEDRVSVPRAAVLERSGKLLVFRASGGRAEWQYVETGLESLDRVEITSGVAAGDTVLVSGHLTIAHGAPVKVSLR
jgi:RND family efflux transporter MFP subunit